MKTILIIEDHKCISNPIKILLEAKGYKALQSFDSDILEGLALLDIDLIILDLMIPGINGVELFNKIKEIKPNIKVMILTALTNAKDKFPNLNKADGYITKPYDNDVLLETVKKILGDNDE